MAEHICSILNQLEHAADLQRHKKSKCVLTADMVEALPVTAENTVLHVRVGREDLQLFYAKGTSLMKIHTQINGVDSLEHEKYRLIHVFTPLETAHQVTHIAVTTDNKMYNTLGPFTLIIMLNSGIDILNLPIEHDLVMHINERPDAGPSMAVSGSLLTDVIKDIAQVTAHKSFVLVRCGLRCDAAELNMENRYQTVIRTK